MKSNNENEKNAMLREGAIHGDVEEVRRLIAEGADVNAANTDGETALMSAARNGHIETAKLLISKDANINAADKIGVTVLMLAVSGWTNPEQKSQSPAADMRDIAVAVVPGFVKNEISREKNAKNAENRHAELAKLLIDAGANINAASRDGWTALMYAAACGNASAVKMLIDKGADVKVKNCKGKTALDIARERGLKEAIRLLEAAYS